MEEKDTIELEKTVDGGDEENINHNSKKPLYYSSSPNVNHSILSFYAQLFRMRGLQLQQ